LEKILWPRGHLGILRNHAQFLLVRKDRIAQLVPAAIEQMHRVNLVHPFLRRMMWRVCAAGNVVAEERLAGVNLICLIEPPDRVVGHGGGQIPSSSRLADVRVDGGCVAKQIWLPLAGVAANKAVEVVEAHAGGPMIEGPKLAGVERGCVVVLAE